MCLRGAKDKESGLVCACAVPKTKSTDRYALVHAEEGKELVCACAAPKAKSTDWYALARRRRQRVRIGMCLRSAEDKEYGSVCACAR